MIVAYRARNRAVFLFGFAKNERENIEQDELAFLRRIAENWLAADSEAIQKEIEIGNLQEVKDGEEA
jgi:hypothetical protein